MPTRTPPVTLAASPRLEEFRELQETLRPFNLDAQDISEVLASTGLPLIEYQSVGYGLVTLTSSSEVVQAYQMQEEYAEAGLRLAYREDFGPVGGGGGPYPGRVISALAIYGSADGAKEGFDLGPSLYAFSPLFSEDTIEDIFPRLDVIPVSEDDYRIWEAPSRTFASVQVGEVVGTVIFSSDDSAMQAVALLGRFEEKLAGMPEDVELPEVLEVGSDE